jgi:hypothetical protein
MVLMSSMEITQSLPHYSQVDFVHRTVREFLASRDARDFLVRHTGPMFKPDLSLCNIYLALLKVRRPGFTVRPNLSFPETKEFLYHAYELEKVYEKSDHQLIDEFERVSSLHASLQSRDAYNPCGRYEAQGKQMTPFISVAASSGLRLYIIHKLSFSKAAWDSSEPLFYVLRGIVNLWTDESTNDICYLEVLEIILSTDTDRACPNSLVECLNDFPAITIWHFFLADIHDCMIKFPHRFCKSDWQRILWSC